jgi:4-amino-4-deoxy-L-arabinose transferase-like glycosyltransferase
VSGAQQAGPFSGPPEAESSPGPDAGAEHGPEYDSAPATGSAEARRVIPTWLFVAASVLVTAWAVFQNFFRIGTAPILADEPTYIESAWQYVHGTVRPPTVSGTTLVSAPGNFEHPPLTKYLFGLAQVLDGHADDLTASRCVSSLATLLTGLIVAVWLGREAGRWTGLVAGGLLTLLPESASGSLGRFDRFAMLDPVASLFMVLSVVLAWEWARRAGRAARERVGGGGETEGGGQDGSRRRGSAPLASRASRGAWTFAALTGAAVGLAAGSKENGFLGAVGPVVLTVLLAAITRPRDRRAILTALGQAAAAVLVAVLVFVALYLPLGNPVTCIKYLVNFQSTQSSAGHLIGFAGRVSSMPPWWANLWFAGHSYGSLLTGFLIAAAVLAVVLRRDLLVGWCAAALAVPFVFHCFLAHVALGYYWVMWTPMFLALAGIGVGEVVKLITRAVRNVSVPLVLPVTVLVSAAALAIPVGESIGQTATVAELQPNGVQVLPGLMKQHHLALDSTIVSTGVGSWAYSYYVPKAKIDTTASGPVPGAALIVISTVQCRDPLDASVRALARINAADGHAVQIYADSSVTVYEVTGTLAVPTAADISAEPASNATDGC